MALYDNRSPQLGGGSSMSSTTNQTFKVENVTGSPQPGPSELSNIKMEIDSIESPQPGTSATRSSPNLNMQNIPLSVNRSPQSGINGIFIQSSGIQNVTPSCNTNFGSPQPGSSEFGGTSNRSSVSENFASYENGNSQASTSGMSNAFSQNSGVQTPNNFGSPQPGPSGFGAMSNRSNELENFAPYEIKISQSSTSGINNAFSQNSGVQTLNFENSQPSSSGFGGMSNQNDTYSTFYNGNYCPNGTNYNTETIFLDINCSNDIFSDEDLLNSYQVMNPNYFGAAEHSAADSSPFNNNQANNQNHAQSFDPFNAKNILDISNLPNGTFTDFNSTEFSENSSMFCTSNNSNSASANNNFINFDTPTTPKSKNENKDPNRGS